MTQTTHPVDERLPSGKLAALGLQHVLVMYAGAVAVPLIVGRALKLSPEQVAMLISADVFDTITEAGEAEDVPSLPATSVKRPFEAKLIDAVPTNPVGE